MRPAVHVPRPVLIAAAAVVALIVAVAGGVAWGHRTESSAAVLAPAPTHLPSTSVPAAPTLPVWRDLVARFDALRAAAFATGDDQMLAAIYVRGGAAAAHDAATLRTFASHGWHVRGLHITTRTVVPDVVTPDAATLVVTDEMSPYAVVDAGGAVVQRVGARRPVTFAMQLVRIGASWRIESISR
jgi:hypothetical protein